VGSGSLDHGRIEVDTCHVEAVLASQEDRQLAGPAPDLQHSGAVRGHRRDVGGDAPQEGAEQEPVDDRVIDGGIADEDASRHPSPGVRTAEVSRHGEGCGSRCRRERNHKPS
jgi:hypothetical protein